MTGAHFKERLTSPSPMAGERDEEKNLRPLSWDDFVGQERVVENLKVFLSAARARGEALDHCLFLGPPGLGKTTLAHIIAREMGVQIFVTSGPALEKPYDLAGILTNLKPGDVLFIDEIHRLNVSVEEYLYPAMEDYRLDIVIDRGPGARAVQIRLPHFTLIGATTRAGLLTAPLRARFGISARLDYYTPEELLQILQRSAKILGVELDPEAAQEVACRSRGTPRVANRLLRRLRDFAQVQAKSTIDLDLARHGLERLEIDPHGLDEMDLRILGTLVEKFGGGPVGLNTIAVAVGEEPDTIEEIYEPFLIQQGFLERTPRGRKATLRARHLFSKTQTLPLQGKLIE